MKLGIRGTLASASDRLYSPHHTPNPASKKPGEEKYKARDR